VHKNPKTYINDFSHPTSMDLGLKLLILMQQDREPPQETLVWRVSEFLKGLSYGVFALPTSIRYFKENYYDPNKRFRIAGGITSTLFLLACGYRFAPLIPNELVFTAIATNLLSLGYEREELRYRATEERDEIKEVLRKAREMYP